MNLETNRNCLDGLLLLKTVCVYEKGMKGAGFRDAETAPFGKCRQEPGEVSNA